ncbi:LysR family transcriptional regulator [Mangrovicoccus sp. HB161399]|uniref:LysR family transcriptional regulator n=1 Tax=Mangrovicoccus sp. HB161399 TaxID=2720392 RepID=UPI0015560183|nr:LysR family transcriptional regulator [Mangrovicoccus sp. HB161399]
MEWDMALHLVPKALLYVEAVAEHGSIQAASRATGIAASAIDRQVKLLEDRLGVLLFDRQTRGMALSAAGEMFVLLAQRWRADEARIVSDVKQMQGVDLGHIRLATMDSLVNGLVPRFLAEIAARYPRVRVDVEVATPDDAAAQLEEGLCDMVLCFNLRPHRDFHVLWSAELPLCCVAAPSHPLASLGAVSLKEVREHAIVVQSRALAIRRILEARHSWIFSDGPPPVVTNSLQLLKQLVISGSHVALTSEMDAAPELLSGRAVALPVEGPKIAAQSISMAINARRSLPRIAGKVAECLASEAQDTLETLRGTRPG